MRLSKRHLNLLNTVSMARIRPRQTDQLTLAERAASNQSFKKEKT